MKINHKLMVISIIIMAIVLTGCKNNKAKIEEQVILEEPLKELRKAEKKLSVDEIVEVYNSDIDWLKEAFKGDIVELNGDVRKFDYDILGTEYIDMDYDIQSGVIVRCYLDESVDHEEIQKGDSIRIVGEIININEYYIEISESEFIKVKNN